jgi:hypothetical protein
MLTTSSGEQSPTYVEGVIQASVYRCGVTRARTCDLQLRLGAPELLPLQSLAPGSRAAIVTPPAEVASGGGGLWEPLWVSLARAINRELLVWMALLR